MKCGKMKSNALNETQKLYFQLIPLFLMGDGSSSSFYFSKISQDYTNVYWSPEIRKENEYTDLSKSMWRKIQGVKMENNDPGGKVLI